MYVVGAVVLCVASTVHGGWLQELTLARGLQLGGGISLHLDRLPRKSESPLESHALRVDYADLGGFSVGKEPHKDALRLEVYAKDAVEGRGRHKLGEFLVPAAIGYKTAAVTFLGFALVKMFVVKALGVAMLSFLVAGVVAVKYFFFKGHKSSPYIEYEEMSQHPVYYEYPSAGGYNWSPANLYAVANVDPSGKEEAESSQYSVLEAAPENSTENASTAKRRYDFVRRKPNAVPVVTMKKYTIKT